jgi:hypothetical protein
MDQNAINLADYEVVQRTFQFMRENPWSGTIPTPDCRFLDDPPGKALALAYVQECHREEAASVRRAPVFCAEIPITPANRTEGYLPTALLKQLGTPMRNIGKVLMRKLCAWSSFSGRARSS